MLNFRTLISYLCVSGALCFSVDWASADTIRVAVQRTGTVSWELDVIRAHKLDKQGGINIKTLELASPEAGKIALRGGAGGVVAPPRFLGFPPRRTRAQLRFSSSSSSPRAVTL